MRAMNHIALHYTFVGQGCAGIQVSQPAATVEAGAMWMDVYNAVTTMAGRYVQGGCATVGVAGPIQSGGFGSFSKNYGMAAAGLLEAEVVTADGAARIADACTNPDLFWEIKGGGGQLWRCHQSHTQDARTSCLFRWSLRNDQATSDATFRRLIDQFISFYNDNLFIPHWGESITFRPDNTVAISMVFQGLNKQQAVNVWQPFFNWLARSAPDLAITAGARIRSIPARHWWDGEYIRKNVPDRAFTHQPAGSAGNPCVVGSQSRRGRDLPAWLGGEG